MENTKVLNGLFEQDLKVVNIGLLSFAEALREVGVEVVQVDWSPPAGGNDQALAALKALAGMMGQ